VFLTRNRDFVRPATADPAVTGPELVRVPGRSSVCARIADKFEHGVGGSVDLDGLNVERTDRVLLGSLPIV